MKKILIITIIILLIFLGLYFLRNKINKEIFSPQEPKGKIGITKNEVVITDIEIIANSLQIPWEITFLPSGEMLVTERTGNLLKIGKDKTIIKIEGVEHAGEGGLQGMALHPDFLNNNWIYLYLTTKNNNSLINRVERYKFTNEKLSDKTIIIDNIPGAKFHDGGRIKFGPDNKLYITTGDATERDSAQDLNYLGGKILRLNDDGSIPEDNPFGTVVYSYGHRNPQGITWDDKGNLWATEHGRSVPLSGYDELNIIEAGNNYGWPIIQGAEEKEGMVTPVIQSGADFTWAPAGAAFWDESIFFAGLRGEALYEFNIKTKELKTHFFKDYGRLRAVVLGSDKFIYISTSNTDGRGNINKEDDKIIKINPKIFR